jgi:hypothetical protein
LFQQESRVPADIFRLKLQQSATLKAPHHSGGLPHFARAKLSEFFFGKSCCPWPETSKDAIKIV